jgi:WhiB family redox-sensing transcriptional regulator
MAGITTGAADWNSLGNCRAGDPDRLFVTGSKQREARRICRGCPVLAQCLAMALDERIEFGVWGGMTERERRAMLKTRPEVTSWRRLLTETARRKADPALTDTPPSPPARNHTVAREQFAALVPLPAKQRHTDPAPPSRADAA